MCHLSCKHENERTTENLGEQSRQNNNKGNGPEAEMSLTSLSNRKKRAGSYGMKNNKLLTMVQR